MIESDDDRLDMLDDWDPGTYKSNPIYGILENAYVEVGGVESLRPTYFVRDSDVPGIAQGDSISVNSVNYTVRGVQSDGTGFSLLVLQS